MQATIHITGLGATSPDDLPRNSANTPQCVLILVGLVGSGKSTFAEALQTHIPAFVRCNQDDLGDRRTVEHMARQSLANGQSICIDRTNFDAAQRAHWIAIGREFPGTNIWVIVFDTPYQVCAERLRYRTNHPTIKTPEQGLTILRNFARQLTMPEAYEGHERLLYLQPEDTSVNYSKQDVERILKRVQDSPEVTYIATTPGHHPGFWRGGSGYRGNSHGTESWNDRGRNRGSYQSRGGRNGFYGSGEWRRETAGPSQGPSIRNGWSSDRGLSRGNHDLRDWTITPSTTRRGDHSGSWRTEREQIHSPAPVSELSSPKEDDANSKDQATT